MGYGVVERHLEMAQATKNGFEIGNNPQDPTFFFKWTNPGLYFFIFVFSIQFTVPIWMELGDDIILVLRS